MADCAVQEVLLNHEGSLSHVQALSSSSKAAVKQCSPQTCNKECLQRHSTVGEDGEEEKEMENKAKDGREEGQKVVYKLTKSLKSSHTPERCRWQTNFIRKTTMVQRQGMFLPGSCFQYCSYPDVAQEGSRPHCLTDCPEVPKPEHRLYCDSQRTSQK